MRYGIVSDIHGNLEAFEAVLADLQQEDVKSFYCLGDVVGYGANPAECLSLVKKHKMTCVAGNHDWAVAGKTDSMYFSGDAKKAAKWTSGQISKKDLEFLNSLNLVVKTQAMTLVHGTLNEPGSFHYLLSPLDAQDSFPLMESTICFIGHTHVPQIISQQGEQISTVNTSTLKLESNKKYIINVGSVGQPRDGDPKAAYAVYDTDEKIVQIKRIAYDIQGAQKKILEAGLPEFLAQRLKSGQ